MAISFIAASAVVTGANPTVAVPAGYAQQDLLVIITTGTSIPTTPSGWTRIANQGSNGFIAIYTKFATSTEASVAMTINGSTTNAVMLAYRGASAIDIVTLFSTGNPSVTSSTNNCTYNNEYVVTVYGCPNTNASTWTAPASTNIRVNSNNSASVNGLLIVDELQTTAGTSASRTASVSASNLLSTVTFGIIPSGRYWVGGTGSWFNTTTNWSFSSGGASGAPIPTANDPVFFDQAATYTVTLVNAQTCFNMTVSAGTVTFVNGSSPSLTVSGSMSLSASTVWSATGLLTFNSTSTDRTITTNAITINSPITFNGVGGAWSLGSALTTDSTATTTLTNGSLNLNGFNLTTGIFSSNNANTRVITFGSNYITVSGSGTVWDTSTLTNLTITGTPTVNVTNATATATSVLSGSLSEAQSISFNFTAGTYALTFFGTAGYTAKNVNFTGFAGTLNVTQVCTVYGSYTISSGMTVTASPNTLTFAATSGTNTITTASKIMPPITINGVGGTFNLGDNLNFAVSSGSFLKVNGGTFNTNNYNIINASSFDSYSVPGNIREINLGSSTITMSSQGGLHFNATNLTFNAGTSTISIPSPSYFTFQIDNGNLTFYNVSFGSTSSYVLMVGTITFNNLTGPTLTSGLTSYGYFSIANNIIVNGTFTLPTPSNTSYRCLIKSATVGSQVTITAAAVSLNYCNFQNINAGGSIPWTGTALGDSGNNNNITFTSGVNKYWSLVGGGNWDSVAWALTSGGTPSAANYPLPQDTCIIQNTGLNSAATISMSINATITTLDMSGRTNLMFFSTSPGATLSLVGDWINGTGVNSISGNGGISFINSSGGTQNITSAGKLFSPQIAVNTNGTVKLLDNLDQDSTGNQQTFTLTLGTLDINNFSLSTAIFSSSNSNVRAINFGSGYINLTNTTAGTTVLNLGNASNFTGSGAGGFRAAMTVTRTFDFGTSSAPIVPPNLFIYSGASVPTITTGGYYNLLDFTGSTCTPPLTTLNLYSLTLASGGTYTSLRANMVATGTITGNGKSMSILICLSGTTTISGTLSASLTVNGGTLTNPSGAVLNTATFTLTTGTVNLNGGTLPTTATFAHTAGTVNVTSATSLTATSTYTFTAGTITLTADLTVGIFSSSNTNTRSISFGSNNIILAHTTAAQTVLSMAIATGFTYTSNGGYNASSTGCFYSTMSTTRTFVFGTTDGSTTNAPLLYLASGASIATITTGSWFNTLNFGTTSFTIAATSLNLLNLITSSSTGVLTNLTATMRDTGSVITSIRIGPLIINHSGTTTMASLTTNACTTLTVTSGNLVIDANSVFNCTTTATLSGGTLLNYEGLIQCTTFTIAGSTFVLSAGSVSPSVSFVITSGAFTLNYSPAGGLSSLATFTHTAGTVQFNTNYSLTATGTYTFTAGTLSINDGITLSTGIFSSTNANSRTINFGITSSPGYIALTHTTAATVVLSMAIVTGLTVNALGKWNGSVSYAPAQIAGGFRSETTVTRTFTCGTTGGNSTNAPCLYVTGTGAVQLPTFTTASWFGDLSIGLLSAMTIAATTLNINSLYGQGYYYTLNTTSMSLNFVGSGFINYQGDTNNTFGILGTVTINHAGTTAMVYSTCAATTVNFTSGTLECRYWVNGGFNGYGQFILTGAFTQTGGTWYGNAVYIYSCTTYTINGPTISFDSGSITATTGMTLTSGSFTFNGGTLASVAGFTQTAGAVTIKNSQTISLTATGTYTFTSGSLVLEDAAVLNTGIFSSSGTGTRSITFGTTATYPALINLTHTTAATTVLSMATVTNFTYTTSYNPGYSIPAGFASDMVNTRTFVFGTTGGSITNSPNLRITGSSTPTITTASWFNILDFSSAQTFTLPATSLNLNSLIPAYAYNTVVLTGLTANMRGPGILYATGASSVGPVVINNSGTTQLLSYYFAPTYGPQIFNCTTLTITAGNLDGGVQKFTGSCTSGVLTTTGSPTLVPGTNIYDNVSVPYGYIGTVVSGSGNTWVLADPAASFALKDLWVGGSQAYITPATLACSGAVTWTGGTLTNFGSTTAYVYGDGKNSITWTCTTFTVNGPTFNHTLSIGGTINPSTSFVLTAGSYTYNGGVLGAVPLFTHTSSTVTFNYNYSLTTTGTYTLTAGTLTLADGVILNTGIFSSTGAGTRSIGFGSASASNINLTHTTAATTVLNMAALGGFSYTGTGGFTVADMANTRTFSVGNTSGGSLTTAPKLTFTTGASIPTLTTASWFNNLDFGTTSFAIGTTSLNITADLTLSSSGTYTSLTAVMVDTGTATLTTNGKTMAALTINGPAGVFTFAGIVTVTGALTLTAGTVNTLYAINSGSFASTGTATRSIIGTNITYTVSGAGATAFSNASGTGLTMSGFVISMTNAAAKTFAGGGGTYPVLNNGGAGALTISGSNTFDTISNSVQPTTFTFTIATTQTVNNFNVAGIPGSLVTINSSTAATAATLSKASGTVYGSYLSIRDSTATGGATWYAGPTSTNTSNNTGWIFDRLPIVTFGSLTMDTTAGGITISNDPIPA